MANFFEMARLKNLFSNPQALAGLTGNFADAFQGQNPMDNVSFGNDQIQMPQPAQQSPVDDYNAAQRMRELYSPETIASDRFNKLADSHPVFEEPTKMRKFGGAILGSLTDLGVNLGGNKTKNTGMDAYDDVTGKNKYRENVGKWKEEIGPAGQAATLERTNNTNERSMAHQTITSELADRKNTAANDIADRKTKIQADRASVYRWRAEHPNKKIDFSGPTVLLADPITGEVTDTGVSTGSLSDEDKANLGQKHSLAKIAATGGQARETEGVKEVNREKLIPLKGAEDRLTRATPSGATGANRPETPAATRTKQNNNARQFAAENPNLAKYIKTDKNGNFTITKPGGGGYFSSAGPTEAEHAAITNAIYGSTAPPQSSGRGSAPNPNPSAQAPFSGNSGTRVIPPQTGTGPMNRTIRNKTTGETKQQTSIDGGKTWYTH